MTTPTFPLTNPALTSGEGVTLALTQDVSPDNPVEGDLDLQYGQLHLWDKRAARRQKVKVVLKFGEGEHWLNPAEGIPYFSSVIGVKQKQAVLGIFRSAFFRTMPDLVNADLAIEFNGKTRRARIPFELRFDDGMVLRSSDFAPLELVF